MRNKRILKRAALTLAATLLFTSGAFAGDPEVELPPMPVPESPPPPEPEAERVERRMEGEIGPEEARERHDRAMERLREQTYPAVEIEPGEVVIEIVPDPLEPLNRGIFAVTREALEWVIFPVTSGYRFLLPRPVRDSIYKFGYNLEYPVRLVNTLLQGQGGEAAHETGRFVVNSTVGLLGLFDPATRLGLETYEEDFGQTFGWWGAGTGPYLFNPLDGGGSSVRDTVGWVGDTALDPATYVPGLGVLFGVNDLSFQMDTLKYALERESDPYILLRELWGIDRFADVVDYVPPPEAYEGTPLPTLGALFLQVEDPNFNRLRDERVVRVEGTGGKLPYSLWMQEDHAPLVYVLPGIGSHRNNGMVLALAEKMYGAGFSVVSISSPFNYEFMKSAATSPVPGYSPADAYDVYQVLSAIQDDLEEKYGDRIGEQSMMGLSLGGLHTLYLAGTEEWRKNNLGIERYIAVNPPVRPIYPLDRLDDYFEEPLEWPEETRRERIVETMLKAVYAAQAAPAAEARIPLDESESRFLIGLTFRYVLRNTIYMTQSEEMFDFIEARESWWSREDLYREISAYGYRDYFELFVLPYYWEFGLGAIDRDTLIDAASLTALTPMLRDKPNVYVFTTQNDFVINKDDLEWIGETFGRRATIYTDGGHLGELPWPRVQKDLLQALTEPVMVLTDSPPGEPTIVPLAPVPANGRLEEEPGQAEQTVPAPATTTDPLPEESLIR